MTTTNEARDAIAEARNHVENFPITEGDALRVTRLADTIESLLADRDRLAATLEAGDYYEGLEEGFKIGRIQAYEQAALEATRPAGNVRQDFSERQTIIVNRIKRLASADSDRDLSNPASYSPTPSDRDGTARAAAYRADSDREPPTVEEWAAMLVAEQERQVAKGYDGAHDDAHGIRHLLNWAIDYDRRGKTVEAAAMKRAALQLLDRADSDRDLSNPASSSTRERMRAALEAAQKARL